MLIFRELASENPGKFKHGLAHALHLPDLADALTHQAQWLRDLGHDADAEVSASEASGIGHQIENRR